MGGGMAGRASRSTRTSPARNRGSNGVGFGRGGSGGHDVGARRQKAFLKRGSGPVSQRTLDSQSPPRSRSTTPGRTPGRSATSAATASELKRRLTDRQSQGSRVGPGLGAAAARQAQTRAEGGEGGTAAEGERGGERAPDEGGVDEVVWGTKDGAHEEQGSRVGTDDGMTGRGSGWAEPKQGDILISHPTTPSHSVRFAMCLDSLVLADFSDAKKAALANDLVKNLGVSHEQVRRSLAGLIQSLTRSLNPTLNINP